MIELPKPLHPYKKITKRNADQFFADCMLVKNDRISWIKNLAISQGVDAAQLDLSKESLPILWGSIYKFVKMDSPAPFLVSDNDLTPEWFVSHYEMVATREKIDAFRPKQGYDLLSLWIMDGLAYYFGEVFVKEFKHISWQSIVVERYEMTCMPHIVSNEWKGFKFCTWRQVATNMVRVWHPDFSVEIDGFNKAFDGLIELAQMAP